uniref:RiboL-PSP-HEPN domain-containing protein n=1 Tax=Candidatus Kentrum sp. FM TaxID=2126340 RepID=A0A450TFM4_9GAMM|nr:MAG: hypothetical protein BECKFM1743C_GA0114222_104094 [Candidatus Kentron sp. FM]VFJ66073.1 MAG: hypothetical protein BECKFM1743A_GA0114220_104002 [Candidatus Kentron sp. FM]VFK16061.1 MAG: hypothetical protein BECKFM1743B_GA0114221_104012 [Candidatus Kentron sp. FM]
MYRKNVYFNTKINTESNANLKVTNTLLNRLSLQELPNVHEKMLNRLLRFRNSMAHGDDGIEITQADLDQFSILVQNLASDLILSILDGLDHRVYLKNA